MLKNHNLSSFYYVFSALCVKVGVAEKESGVIYIPELGYTRVKGTLFFGAFFLWEESILKIQSFA